LTKKSVLVLGAGGFIGRRVVTALAATAWAQPVAASRNILRARLESAVQRISLDASDRGALVRAMESASAVVSCIAGTGEEILRSGRALLEAASGPSPPRVVFLSSMAAYGSVHGIVSEEAPLLGDLDDYALAKASVEKLAEGRPEIVRLRPGIVYGPRSPWWSDQIARLLMQHRLGDLGSGGEGFCNLVHVDDVATAVVRALELPHAGGEAINLGSPQPPTWNEYFRRYAQALGATPVRHIGGLRLLLELAVRGPSLKLAEMALGGSNPWPDYPAIRPWLAQLCRREVRIDVSKAERLLGMQWRSLDAGLDQTASWFLSNPRD
jgi:2-alkyl-3-oxoalkanoate reductase